MKKRILALILCALVLVSSVPATPVSDLLSVQAVAVSIERLQSVFDAAPAEDEWDDYVNISSFKGYYNYAQAILRNPSSYTQDDIDECADDLEAAVAALQPYAAGISLNKDSVTVAVGKTAQLNATLLPSGSGGEISWSSSHSAYVSVSSAGLVSVNRYTAESVTIQATVTGKGGQTYSDICLVKVTNPVAGISLSSDSLTLYNGESRTLTTKTVGMDSTAAPSDDVIYTWDSDDTSVAVVENGLVTAKGVGTCKITVRVRNLTDSVEYKDTCTVTVNKLVPVQSLIPDSLSALISGQKKNYSISFMPSNASIKTLSWTTSASDVVAVSDIRVEDGKAVVALTAGKVGVARLTYEATDGSGVSGSVTVEVKPKITNLTLSHTSKAITLASSGERIVATITPADAGYQVLDWASDNQRVCKVDYNGILTPVAPGECTITVSTKDGSNIERSCKVIVCETASSVKITAPSTTLENGGNLRLSATVTTTDGYSYNDVKWTSSNTSIATVNENGVVTAVYPGSVAIKAEAVDGSGKFDTCVIKVIQSITGLYIQENVSVAVGKSFTLTPSITPSYATERNLSWSTSDIAVASVTPEGLVTAKNVGTAKITVTSSDGKVSATCTVKVIVPATGITISSDSEELWKGNVVQLVALVTPSGATDKSVKWASSNLKVATVTSDGLVTAVAGGSCVITAANSSGQTDSCRITVYEDCTGVELESSAKAMYVGQSYTMTASVIPSTATNRAVTWTSSVPSVATVSSVGVIKALKEGSTVITVKTVNGGFTASCTITVYGKVPVTGIVLDRRSVTVPIGVIDQLIATLSPSNASEKGVVWTCDNPGVLAFNQKGQFKGLKAGTAILTATSVDGHYTDQCRVTVTQPVTGVRITTTGVKLAVNKSKALDWTVFPEDATNKKVTWKSSDPTVATVNASGVVTAKKSGTTVISVTTVDGGFTSTCNFTVYVPVTGVAMNKTSGYLAKGTTYLLSAAIEPSNATNKAVSWVSSNTSVVRVNEAGQVTGVGKGTANVTCTTADGAYKATCKIRVYQVVEKITLDIASVSLEVGKTKTVIAKYSPSTADFQSATWTSSNPKIASVDADGVIKGVSAGTVTITALSKDKYAKATCKVTVIQPATGIKLNHTSGYVRIGEVGVLKATVLPANASNQKVTWSTSDKTRATVNADGVVTGISQGYVNITAKTVNGGHTATCKILVVKSVTGVRLDKTSVTVNVGKTTTITPTVYPADATVKTVYWTSSNYDVANVDTAGKVTAKAPGYAVITAKTKDGSFTAKTEVLVIQPVTGVKLNKTASYLNLGASMTLVPTVSPSDASIKSVTWTSSNPSIATVSSSGVVTGIKSGTVTITCKTTNGSKIATCKIAVVKRVTGISLNKEEAILYFGRALTLTSTIYPLDASVKDVIYSSTDSGVASVSAAGVVTPVNTGTTYIVATTKDGGYKAYCKVMVGKAPESIKLGVTSATMIAGKSGTLKYAVYPTDARNRAATFTTSNPDVATVTSTGVVTAVARGTANITATTENGIKAVCKLTVVQPVTGIEISDPAAEVYTGEKFTLTAKILPGNANNQNVIWSSSDSRIASVSSTGTVTGVKAGTADIIVTSADGSYTAKCSVTVKQHVTAIEFAETDIFINKGSEADLRFSVLPYDATDKSVTFESSDRELLTVTGEGHIIAHLGGKVTITVTSKDTGVSAKCYVTIQEPATGVSLNYNSKEVFVGDKLELIATVSPADATNKLIGWSSDSAIASVDSNGVVTALKSGVATITATTADGGHTASCTLTLLQRATEITVNEEQIKFNRGESYQLTAAVLPEDCYDKAYEWKSGDENIATVDKTGLVTGIAPGEVELTCTSKENSEVKKVVKVTIHEPVATITLKEKPQELYTPLSFKLEAVIAPENASDKSVTWSSSDEEIATVSEDGTVTAHKKGEVTITVTSNDNGKSDFFTLNVFTGAEEILTEKDEYSLHENTELKLDYSFNPEAVDDDRVTFESSDRNIFTVNSDGTVKGVVLGDGELTITSMQNPEVKKTVIIHVTRAVTDITLDATEKVTYVGEAFTLGATVLPEDASDKSLTWSSNNEDVASVNENGEVTAISRGFATITAKTNDGEIEATCAVEVVQNPEEIVFDGEQYSVNIGETLELNATVLPENTNDPSLIWKSSDERIATVSEDGVVTPVKAGSCEIIAVSAVKEEITKSVKLDVIQLATEIQFLCRIPDLYAGERLRVFATVLPEDTTDKSHTWSSSDENVATVDEYGVITAVSAGNVQIIAKSCDEGAVEGIINLKVVEKISGIKLDKTSLKLEVNQEETLVAEVLPAFAYDKSVIFESSNEEVASVDENGKVVALSLGQATITATTADGSFTAEAEVRVVKYVTEINIIKGEFNLESGMREKVEFSFGPEDATETSVIWKSSDEKVALVSDEGVITAVGKGTATITVCSADDESVFAFAKVIVDGGEESAEGAEE